MFGQFLFESTFQQRFCPASSEMPAVAAASAGASTHGFPMDFPSGHTEKSLTV